MKTPLALALCLAACSGQKLAEVVPDGPDAGSTVDTSGYRWQADNPIDQVMRPKFAASKIVPTAAGDREFCRRASADLRGFVPTLEEIDAHCAGKSPSEIVAYFLAAPEFTVEQQRQWLQALEVDPGKVFAAELLELDPLIAQLASGALSYDAFVVTVVGLPAVATNVLPKVDMRQDPMRFDEAAARVLRVFRGRSPVGTEKAELAKLFAFWARTLVNDPQTSVNCGNQRYSPELAPENCTNELGAVACTALLGGQTIAIQLPAGHVSWESFAGKVPAAVRAELDKPGQWLVSDDEFWEAASSRALSRLLGWYQSTRNIYESDLPEVRAALASWWRAQPDRRWPLLLSTVMTSVLYAQTAEPGAAMDRPDWATAPTKFLTAEGRLQSLGQVLGRTQLGFCDPHTNEPIGSNTYFPDRFRKMQPANFYGFGYDFFQTYGSLLGGCQGGTPVPRQPTLSRVFAEPSVAAALLGDPGTTLGASGFTPATSDDSVLALADFIARRAFGRPLTDDERSEVTKAATDCRADATCSQDPVREARSLASSLLISAEAGVY